VILALLVLFLEQLFPLLLEPDFQVMFRLLQFLAQSLLITPAIFLPLVNLVYRLGLVSLLDRLQVLGARCIDSLLGSKRIHESTVGQQTVAMILEVKHGHRENVRVDAFDRLACEKLCCQ
jgi:hypothetical protein